MHTNKQNWSEDYDYYAGLSYYEKLQEIKQSYEKKWLKGVVRQDPYKFYPWEVIFSRTEWNVWEDIRYLGIPMYPQFPVGRFFIDFADPFNKIGIEVDGKVHDNKEVAERDRKREDELNEMGWTLFRIPGKYTFRSYKDYEKSLSEVEHDAVNNGPDQELEYVRPEFWTNCSEGILRRIREKYY